MFGKFKAMVLDYGVSESKSGNPQVYIKLNVEAEGSAKTLTWYGSFTGGAKDITLKTLINAGLQPQHYGQLANLNKGVASSMLDITKVLEADVQEEPKQDGSGVRTVVQWLNDPTAAPQIKKIDEAKNLQFFGSMGFENDLVRLAGELGISLNNGGQATMGNNANMQNNNPHNQAPAQNYQTQGQQQTPAQNNYQAPAQNQQQMNMQQQPNQTQGQQQNGNGFKSPF